MFTYALSTPTGRGEPIAAFNDAGDPEVKGGRSPSRSDTEGRRDGRKRRRTISSGPPETRLSLHSAGVERLNWRNIDSKDAERQWSAANASKEAAGVAFEGGCFGHAQCCPPRKGSSRFAHAPDMEALARLSCRRHGKSVS